MEVEYLDSPEQTFDASSVLIARSMELTVEGSIADEIWHNLGFHCATARLLEHDPNIPIGVTAQTYIALVLAAKEHLDARKMLEKAGFGGEEGS